MGVAHVEVEACHDDYLEEDVGPGEVDEAEDVEGDGACVEGEYVGPFHYGEAMVAELVLEVLRYFFHGSVSCFYSCHKSLELWCLLLLVRGVVDV